MKKKQILGAAGLVTAGILAGTIMSVAGAANAATTDTTTSTAASSTGSTTAPTFGNGQGAPGDAPGQAPGNFNPGGAAPVRSDETQVTGVDADRLKAAAEAKVAGATAFRIETDGDGAAYEVHMKKADGSLVTVKFDSSFNITSVEDGMGAGGPGGHGGPGDNDGDGPAGAPAAPSAGSTTGTTN